MSETETKKYIETVGRRKTSIARVRLFPSAKTSFTINEREGDEYFPTEALRLTARQPFTKVDLSQKFKVTAKINGGGISSQAGALQHGIARALVKYDEMLRKKLKEEGYLKRDPRMKERRKFGLKKARKAPQWSKR